LDELAVAILDIVSNSYGITRDSLIQETARAYGFARLRENIQTAMQKAYVILLENKLVKESDRKVIKF